MLGFATVDVVPDETYTVWLTSRTESTRANHTNAVVFRYDDPEPWERRLPDQMIADRVVLLTDSATAHLAGVKENLTMDDVLHLARATEDLQTQVSKAFEEYRSLPGKADLVEPSFRPVPPPLDLQSLAEASATERTRAVADALARTWSAWLGTEQERVRRYRYVPWDGPSGAEQALREFPPAFADRLRPHALSTYR